MHLPLEMGLDLRTRLPLPSAIPGKVVGHMVDCLACKHHYLFTR